MVAQGRGKMPAFAYSMISQTFPIQTPRKENFLLPEESQHINMFWGEQKLRAGNIHVSTGEAPVWQFKTNIDAIQLNKALNSNWPQQNKEAAGNT